MTCVSDDGRTELVFEKRGDFHYPLPPKSVSALFLGQALTLEELAEYGGGGEYFFRVRDLGTYRYYVTSEGEFRVERKLFGDPVIVAEGRCNGQP